MAAVNIRWFGIFSRGYKHDLCNYLLLSLIIIIVVVKVDMVQLSVMTEKR